MDSEEEKCVCPRCHADVAEDATLCPKCGEMFPAMVDRRALTTTPATYDALRTFVLAISIVISAVAILAGLVSFLAGH